MAPRDAKTAGTNFLAELYAKLPDALRAKAQEVFTAAEAESAIAFAGESTLRQSDYSKLANDLKTQETELNAWKGQLDTWFGEKKGALEEVEGLRAKVAATPPTPANPTNPVAPTLDPSKFVSSDALARTLEQTERGAVVFFQELNRISMQHFKDFGEILDTNQLLQHKRVQELGLTEVYKDVHKDQLAAKAKAADDARDATIRAEERKKVQAEMAAAHQPYPVRGNEPSTLDGIEAARANPAQAPAIKTADELAAEYARLSAVRTA